MANVKISELAAASSVEDGDLFETSEVQGNGSFVSKKVTASQLKTYATAGTGTVSSVAVSGGTTGLTTSGGPVTTSGTITLGGTLAVANGGTGATAAGAARTNLGLGSIATQAANNVAITGGSVTGITDLAIADGGTGASTASAARSNLGAAASGANSDITSLTGLTTALSIAQGGTGATTAGAALTALGGLPLAGGTLTGALAVTAGTVSAPGIAASGNTNTGIFFPAADTIAFSEGGVEAMRLDSSGRMALGTTTANARFTLAGDYSEGVVTANTGTAYTIALTSGTVQILTLTGNCTFTFPTATAGQSFILLLRQDATGSRTVTWPASVRWPGGTAPTITATANRTDKFIFTSDGTNWLGSNGGQNYSA